MATQGTNRILIVDDDLGIREMVRLILEAEGYQVDEAADGSQALCLLPRGMPDLILLDMKMPVMDGWTFAREFHARFDHQVPIVVLTAAADAQKRAEEIAACAWLGKPFDLDILIATVSQCLGAV